MISEDAMLAELYAARAALVEAEAKTDVAYKASFEATYMTGRNERASVGKAQLAWDKACEEQNRACRRWHEANRALGRPARDDREFLAHPLG